MGELRPIPPVSAFGEHERSAFTVGGDHGGLELELTEIDTSTDTVDGWERFSLVFEGPADERLAQGFYRFDHPELGAFDATLVPVWTGETDSDRAQYQVVVDREAPDREAGLSALGTSSRRGLLGRAALVLAGGGILGSLFASEPVAAGGGGAEPFLGSISMVGFNFAPRGCALCDGQILPIAQNSALFSLLGTTYGGDGRTTFALPDLRGRVPMHPGSGPGLTSRQLGERGGVETVALTESQMPAHSHTASTDVDVSGDFELPVTTEVADTTDPDGNVLAVPGSFRGSAPASPIYSTTETPDGAMAIAGSTAGSGDVIVESTGGSMPHTNVQPYLGVNYIIALQGIFPSRN